MPTKRLTKGFEVNDISSVRTPPPSIFRGIPGREVLKKKKYVRSGIENHSIAGPTRLRMVFLASPSIF
ncbi:MAG: hypothetical protein GY789_28310 [Hyphomicrobiales bacterium]|nr:hypothetical protein [Hyphomicrobiales bacterium]